MRRMYCHWIDVPYNAFTDNFNRHHVFTNHFHSRSANLVISLVCVVTRSTSQVVRLVFCRAAQSERLCVRSDLDSPVLTTVSFTDSNPVAQRWQKKACGAPVRNTGRLTSRVGTALVTIAGISVGLRFLSRWLIKDSTVGWDDWTILASFILLIPSTIMLKNSLSFSTMRPLMTYANFFSTVASSAMGQDIWAVPFENITMMLKVHDLRKHLARTLTDLNT